MYNIQLNISEESRLGLLIATMTSQMHITPDQALETLIEQAVQLESASKAGIKSTIAGLPLVHLDEQEVEMMDDIVDTAMNIRRERLERYARG